MKIATLNANSAITKKMIADYLENTYDKGVEVNRRANATKPGKGKTEGLPLADTHYTLANGNRKCFAYVYETDGAVLLLIKAPSEYADGLSKDHKYINLSAFPKSKDILKHLLSREICEIGAFYFALSTKNDGRRALVRRLLKIRQKF